MVQHTQKVKFCFGLGFILLALSQCTSEPKQVEKPKDTPLPKEEKKVEVSIPDFNADSAYAFIQKQVDFGPRVPNTKEHAACANYLVETLYNYADSAFIQYADATTWDNVNLHMKNIIAVFGPEKKKRILLSAHWDTRPWADAEGNENRKDEPILGANDGGSGVGVLLEIARNLQEKQPELGIDIVLFDAEDWGKSDQPNSFCLGSQYWAQNPHDPRYYEKAVYGINLDMVGAKGSIFAKESESMMHARWVMDKVWVTGQNLGHNEFVNFMRQGIVDDHFYINLHLKVPCIDIINYDVKSGGGFGHFWHTHDDNMDIIDKDVLKAVGETVMHVIYKESRK